MDHRPEADERWVGITALACPDCGLMVLVTEIPLAIVWCGSCPSAPRLERTAT